MYSYPMFFCITLQLITAIRKKKTRKPFTSVTLNLRISDQKCHPVAHAVISIFYSLVFNDIFSIWS